MKMNSIMKSSINIFAILLLILTTSCGKGFLEKKPNSSIVIPSTLSDFQQLLNSSSVNRSSILPAVSADEYYMVSQEALDASTPIERNAYVWNKDIYGEETRIAFWNNSYQSVFIANSVLAQLPGVPPQQQHTEAYNNVEGQAYFVRAFAYFDLLKSFSAPYDAATASADRGVPLKLSPNIDETQPRSSVQASYDLVIGDLLKAASLLPPKVQPTVRNQASKAAAYALFARLYISMRKYEQAELYADSCLNLYDTLVDYNTVSQTSNNPFTNTVAESIFFSFVNTQPAVIGLHNNSVLMSIDTVLLDFYAPYDLRRKIMYNTDPATKLTKTKTFYSNSGHPYGGLATDEIYLIKAECAARAGNKTIALQYLNDLLVTRFATGFFTPLGAADASEALQLVLKERRKELVWRAGLRWDDLRRLNKEGAGITLKRIIGGQTYTLPPNDPRYVFPIPDDEITLGGIEQNIR
ncbi:RagB/SusD family nutrient uptake outer membrane protein [Pseudobacter ginsenosidimutans]|nr:RagB/SusD family nutrient uptake outer membrane protein [Pseudobacter ginsenosidimutans]